MDAMDINKNGSIELPEFKNVMSNWMNSNRKKRNRDDIEEERKEVHNVVKNFFSTNSEPINIDELQMRLKRNIYSMGINENYEKNDTIITSMSQIISTSNKTKVKKKFVKLIFFFFIIFFFFSMKHFNTQKIA